MAVFDPEYMSIDAFLNARLCSMSMGQKADRDYDAMRSDRRRLYRQLSAFGIDKNLFKWHSKSRVFYVTPKAAALFELLLDVEAEGQCGKPFDPQKLDVTSVMHLRSQLLDALLSYHISDRHIMRTLQNYDRAVDFRSKIQQIQKPSERHQNSLPLSEGNICIGSTPIDADEYLTSLRYLADRSKFYTYWSFGYGDISIYTL